MVWCCTGGLLAQEMGSGVRYWEQGRLTWNDFSQRKGEGAQRSELKGFLTYAPERRSINDTMVCQIVVKACLDRDSSWADPEAMGDWEIRYQQVVFDRLKTQSLRLQQEVNRVRRQSGMDSCLQNGFNRYAEEVIQFQKESNFGQDTDAIMRWEEKTRREMAEALLPEQRIPAFSPAAFGFGAHVHAGSNLFTGNLAKIFRPGAHVGIGLDFCLGSSTLLFDVKLGGIKVHADSVYIQQKKWASSDHVELYQMHIAYGLHLLHKGKWQLTPFVGYGMTEISTIAGQNDEVKHKLKTNGWLGGFCVDYALHSSLNLTPNYLPDKECQTLSLRAKCYVSQTDFAKEAKGMTLNFALAINMFDRFIKLR